MKMPFNLAVFSSIAVALFAIVGAEDPYRFFTWNVTYGDIYPLGVRQQVRFITLVWIYSFEFCFVFRSNGKCCIYLFIFDHFVCREF